MRLRRFIRCNSGAAAAEMALLLPIALLLIFTAVESGHYFYSQHQLVKAVRDGTRFGARHSFDEVNCRSGSGAISSGLQTDIRAVALTGLLSGGSEARSGWDASDVTFSVTVSCPAPGTVPEAQSGIYTTAEPAAVINVSAAIGYNSLFNGLGVITDSASLRATQQATVMGF